MFVVVAGVYKESTCVHTRRCDSDPHTLTLCYSYPLIITIISNTLMSHVCYTATICCTLVVAIWTVLKINLYKLIWIKKL